jgi:hypothetical protein
VERLEPGRAAVFAGVAILVLQVTYFYINYFSDPRLRAIHALVVLAVAGSAVAALTGAAGASRFRLGQVAAVTLFGLATLQFAYFYADYFTRYRDHAGNLDTEGNARIAWETIIERAQHRSVPAIHLCEVGPYGFADLYWTFYTIKHHREDLLARTTSHDVLEPTRIRTLPADSLVVTSPSPHADAAIDRMVAAGDLRNKTLVTAPDGVSKFWILEKGTAAAAGFR